MKKIALLSFVSVMGLASCKKAYTCECTTAYSGGNDVSTRQISKTSKKTAEAICGNTTDVQTYSYVSGGQTYTGTDTYVTTCKLK